MKTKIVYVVTDSCISQCKISAISARMHNPEATIIAVTDTVFPEEVAIHFSEIIRVSPKIAGEIESSRWMKTSLREHVKGDFLYIDCDTIICADLSTIDTFHADIGGVLEWNDEVYKSYMYPKYVKQHKKAFNYDFTEKDHYINGGVLYVKDTPYTHKFFEHWHQNWLHSLKMGICFDQPALYLSERECRKIEEMPGVWNCQMERNISYFVDAKILHLFGSRIEEKLIPVFGCNPYDVKILTHDFCVKLEHFKSYFIRNSALIILGDKFPRGRTYYRFKSPLAQKIFMLIYKLFVK